MTDELMEQIDELLSPISINESKRSEIAYVDSCPLCASNDIRSDLDRTWYCYQCGTHHPRVVTAKPQREDESKPYAITGKRRPLHEFTCQYPGCGVTFKAHKAGKCTRKYCADHTNMAIGNAHTGAGRAKRRLKQQENSPSDCVGLTL